MHLLAYLPDPTDPPLAAALDRILAGRTARTPAIVDALRRHGIEITEDDVRRESGGSVAAGRPHVADALVRLGTPPTAPRRSPTCSTPAGPATPTATPRPWRT